MGYTLKKKFGKTWATYKGKKFKTKKSAIKYGEEFYPYVPTKVIKL